VTGELALLDATAQAELVRTGQVSAAELVTAAIERIEALNPVLNAVVTPVFERAAEQARTGRSRRPFAGVPYLVKDLACEMEGVRFTEAPASWPGTCPRSTPSSCSGCAGRGLVILGKTNTPEFGMAPACEPVLFGPTRNPWDTAVPPAGPAAAPRQRWRRAWCRSRTATTWAARCATRVRVRPVRPEADAGAQPARARVR
jgi:amidase